MDVAKGGHDCVDETVTPYRNKGIIPRYANGTNR